MTAKEIEELKKALGHSKPVWAKYVGQIITVIVLSVSIIGSWYNTKAAVQQNFNAIAKQEKVIEKHSSEIENVKLQAVGSRGDITHIKEKVDKIFDKMFPN